jgi:hypothetical protein
VVAERGDGYSGTYRNVWLRMEMAGAVSGDREPVEHARDDAGG